MRIGGVADGVEGRWAHLGEGGSKTRGHKWGGAAAERQQPVGHVGRGHGRGDVSMQRTPAMRPIIALEFLIRRTAHAQKRALRACKKHFWHRPTPAGLLERYKDDASPRAAAPVRAAKSPWHVPRTVGELLMA